MLFIFFVFYDYSSITFRYSFLVCDFLNKFQEYRHPSDIFSLPGYLVLLISNSNEFGIEVCS